MSDPLLILGASARAAAGSAVRAGLDPLTADLFCDDDLRQMIGGAQHIANYPADLPDIARGCPPGPWMFTGALENYPRIIEAISAERPLWGIPAQAIRRVRDPWQLSRALRQVDLLFPDIMRNEPRGAGAGAPPGRWVRKPYRSAGGGNIQLASAAAPADRASKYFLQCFMEGPSDAAVFVAARGAARLLGVTRQLIGADWTGASGFRYCGSIGPLQLDAEQLSQWRRIGDCLAGDFDLQGLFGVDAVVNQRGIWVIEVNPRYSSSVEVLEYGLDARALSEHVAACRDGCLSERQPAPAARFRGKAVVCASRAVPIDAAFVEAARRANDGLAWPAIADIPTAGQVIAAGHPVATLFASSDRLADVEPQLRDVARTWRLKWKL